jgi:hypothetical protein
MVKTPAELYEEREKRLRDAIELKEPDRVPVMMGGGAPRDGKLPASAAYYNIPAWKEATIKSIVEYAPDVYWAAIWNNPGAALEVLDPKRQKWPGYNLPPDIPAQHIETESMKEDEYDLFLSDPSDFIVRYHLPRVYGALAPFAKLPPLKMWFNGLPTMLLVTPEFQQAFEAIFKAGRETEKTHGVTSTFDEEVTALGFPPYSHGGAMAPFDTLTNTYRGMRGAMIDMYRKPEKMLEACEMLASWSIKGIAAMSAPPKRGGPKRMVLPLTRGGEHFMSVKQFETFFWPTLKKVLMAIIDAGAVAIPFCEGNWTSRLHYFLELPRGKAICHFQHYTDMAKAKAILGGHFCLVGSVPPSLMAVGSVQEVDEYCKNLIKVAGKGGGFVLSRGECFEPKPENIRAVTEAARKYGTY